MVRDYMKIESSVPTACCSESLIYLSQRISPFKGKFFSYRSGKTGLREEEMVQNS